MVFIGCMLSILACNSASGAASCETLFSLGARSASPLDTVRKSPRPVVVAHGRNKNVAVESTWRNLRFSVISAQDRAPGSPLVLEVDARMTADGRFVIFHDPTFHRLVRDYSTPQEKVEAFRAAEPVLANQKEGQWDYYLFDNIGSHSLAHIKAKLMIYDQASGLEFEFIALQELLRAVERDGEFRMPRHAYRSRGPPGSEGTVMESLTPQPGPLVLYLDLKDVNHLARRLYGLPDWHWVISSWSTGKIEKYTRKTISALSAELTRSHGHDKVFVTARHPRVAQLLRKIDPSIRIMASPDKIGPTSSASEVIREWETFLRYQPEFVELKYLVHVLDPSIRAWARQRKLKILYNQISQTDPSQFEGPYAGNLARLLGDIVSEGSDLLIQTNTPREVQQLLEADDRPRR